MCDVIVVCWETLKKVEKVQKGGEGVSSGDQKVHNSKCGLFDKRGGGIENS